MLKRRYTVNTRVGTSRLVEDLIIKKNPKLIFKSVVFVKTLHIIHNVPVYA